MGALRALTAQRAVASLGRHARHTNSGHRDFLYASRTRTLKLRYLVRLYAKEMVHKNFPGLPGDQLLERLIELCLYAEEHLR